MAASPTPVTNPGRSENVALQTSLAEAISANLSAGRQEAEPAAAPEQATPAPKPEPKAPEPERQELEAPEPVADGEVHEPTEQDDHEVTERYTLADFAEATELEPDALLERMEVEVTRDGEAKKLSLKEVLDGYRWNAANTQRAQEIAEQRRKIEEQTQATGQLHDQAQAVMQIQWQDIAQDAETLEQQYRAMPWEQLRARGDGSYADAEAQFARRRQEIEARKSKVETAYTQVMQQRQELAQRQQAEVMPRQREAMFSMIPEWRDTAVMSREAEQMTRFVNERFGFTPEEVSSLTDARVVGALHRLWKLESRTSDAAVAAKKVKTPPKSMKPGQRTARKSAADERRQKAAAKLRRTGRRGDLADLVLENIRRK